jgi:hypothetical protein
MPNDMQPPDPRHRVSDEAPRLQIGRRRTDEPPSPADIDQTDVEDTNDAYHAGTPAHRTGRGASEPGPGARARRDLSDLAVRLRSDASQVADPRLHALLVSSAEVLHGLAKAFSDHPDTTESN